MILIAEPRIQSWKATLTRDQLRAYARKLIAMHRNNPPLTALSGPDLLQLQYFIEDRSSGQWQKGYDDYRVEEIIQQHLSEVSR